MKPKSESSISCCHCDVCAHVRFEVLGVECRCRNVFDLTGQLKAANREEMFGAGDGNNVGPRVAGMKYR
jgi:hypothetical protein